MLLSLPAETDQGGTPVFPLLRAVCEGLLQSLAQSLLLLFLQARPKSLETASLPPCPLPPPLPADFICLTLSSLALPFPVSAPPIPVGARPGQLLWQQSGAGDGQESQLRE
jgi:hypothetical protein